MFFYFFWARIVDQVVFKLLSRMYLVLSYLSNDDEKKYSHQDSNKN